MTRRKSKPSTDSSRRSSGKRSGGRRPQSRPALRWPRIRLSVRQWSIIAGVVLIAVAGITILSGLSLSRGKLTDWVWRGIWGGFGYGGAIIPPLLGITGLYLVLWGMEQSPSVRWGRVAGAGMLFLAVEGVFHLFYVARHTGATVEQIGGLGEGGGYLGGSLVTLLEPVAGRVGAWVSCLALAGLGLMMASGVTLAQLGRAIAKTGRSALHRREEPPEQPVPQEQEEPRYEPLSPPEQDEDEAATPEPLPEAATSGLFYGDAVRMAASGYVWERPSMEEVLQPGTESLAVDAQIREQVEIIEQTLASFGAPGRVVEVNSGPVITQYGVEPQYVEQRNGRRTKVKVGQIKSLGDDLALALAAQSIRIEAPVPGKSYVGIEVPNAEVSIVSLRDVMEGEQFARIKSQLKIALGQEVSGDAIAADLAQMPHLLIAGATGSGKSVCVNSIIACLLLHNTPEQLRLLMVDPKRVELTHYNGIPHLLMPVIMDLDKVVGALQWVAREMDNRYRKFAEVGARNIADYHRRFNEGSMPFIVVIIDELADLMIMAPDETERTVCRLAQMARATGIHLVIATQRPSVDVVTGLIKANFPARIAFAVASSTDSRVILDTTGAERLLGRGDLLLMTPDAAQPLRMQGCYVSDRELRRLVDYWRRQRLTAVEAGKAARAETKEPEPAEPAVVALQQPLWEEVIQMERQASEQDDLLEEAIAIVRELGKASVSLLQRRLRIGYTRAARLIDELEAQGVVGPHPGGSRQREVFPEEQAASDEAAE